MTGIGENGQVGFLSTMFRVAKMATTGKIIRQIDTPIVGGRCTLSLRLKRDGQDKHYVVLAGIASGNYQYYPLELSEFSDFASAIDAMKTLIAAQANPQS
ncbi:hypothetical protein ACFWXH_30225 [Mesorhizobium sp. NPDC059054]|uniref:hypothetical protein n=1 Tax=Mesorhizobium sp. NPDC059054 TaxID=3346711 RepID=UPI0036A858AB